MAELVVPTRQKDDELFTSIVRQSDGQVRSAPLPVGGSFQSKNALVLGYSVIRFFATSPSVLRLRVEQAPEEAGPYVEVFRTTSAPSPDLSGAQILCADLAPCAPFMRVFVDNIGAVDADPFVFQAFGHPVGGGGAGGGSSGPSVEVTLEDCATNTQASIKPDGAPISPSPCDGGLLVAGRDPSGFQRHIRVDAQGRLFAQASPGTTITTASDVAVAIGGTVPLPVPPSGTRRMLVQNTGPAGTLIRVREAAGPAGSGIILPRFGSREYGGADGAIAPLEVQEIAGIATTVSIQFERD